IESELFGYEKGAFTGATQRKTGLIEAANKGTLFIDEIGELPLNLQTKLLRVLETGSIRRLGGTEYIKVDVRIIAATNRDPQEMVRNGKFRQDLYYRLSAFPVTIPSLRERKDDIPVLAEFFLHQIEDGEQQIPLSPDVIVKLLDYDYPGNVRELRNIIERAVILAAGNVILPDYIVYEQAHRHHTKQVAHTMSSMASTSRLTKQQILDALEKCHGHRSKAAQMLGVSERTIYRHLK
ncbi:MAG TPA: sigma 54-interacting transcriptional regulator, partial [Gammaproteobacteria bacterium]|nr:sigma 54-interacting transcriptional regulator [Gammaproteobacteria bacterium]